MSFWNFIKSLFEPSAPTKPLVAPTPRPLFTSGTVVTTIEVKPAPKPKAKKAPVKKTKAPKKKPVAKKTPKKK